MAIEIKELIVRAWVDSQAGASRQEQKRIVKTGSEVPEMQSEMLERLKRMITDRKDR
jgi:hypothetical protein